MSESIQVNVTSSEVISVLEGAKGDTGGITPELQAAVDAISDFQGQVPGLELGYAELIASRSYAATGAQLITGLSCALTGTGRPADVELYLPQCAHSVANTTQIAGVSYYKNGAYVGYACITEFSTPSTNYAVAGVTAYAKGRIMLEANAAYQFYGLFNINAAGVGGFMASSVPAFIAVTGR